MAQLTIKELAKITGLSVSTMSRVINDHPDVAPKTRKRVKKIIEEFGYTPNLLAKDLRLQSTKTIGVVISDISNPFFARVVKGIENTARQRKYNIILCESTEQDRLKVEKESIETLLKKRVAGLLLTPVHEEVVDILARKGREIPFVLMSRHFIKTPTNYVVSDDILGSYLATKHLIEKGHRKILYLNGSSRLSDARDRLTGYKKALLEKGISFDESLVKTVSGINMEEAYKVVKRILAKKADFTAIFCFCDYLAMGAMRAIHEAGWRIPEDIAVVGYDDVEVASILEPPLTTVSTPKYQLGEKAVEILLDHLLGKKHKTLQQVVVKPKLMVRKST